ncbi:MAG TPA: GNAT family N-acetyltransferase [Solirubrobacteraceae bacterium]
MSELAQAGQAEWARSGAPAAQIWRVRPAGHSDAAAVAVAVRELLLELGGTPPVLSEMELAARALIDDRASGAVLVARARDGLVGVLGASWQTAIHVPGAYALIQDLWVHPRWRSRAVGVGLLDAIFELARDRGLRRVEVGLPRESFNSFRATEAFYSRNGFIANGPRMRRMLS